MFKKTLLASVLVVSSSLFVLPAIAAVPTQPMTAEQAMQNESYVLGVSAYVWGSTLVRMEQIARQYTDMTQPISDTSYRAPLNEFGHARRLSTPHDLDMPSANRDTLYSSAVLDLSQGPMVLSVPEVNDRYYVINMFDMWHNLFQYVGTRETGQLSKQLLLVPPGWESNVDVPRELQVVEAPTSKVWLWGRTQVFEGSDDVFAHRIQDQYTLTPLQEYLGGEKVAATPLPLRAGEEGDPLRFYEELGAYLKDNPVEERQQAMLGQLAKIGITEQGFDRSNLSVATIEAMIKAVQDGQSIVMAQQKNPAALEIKDGWVYAFNLDGFGDDNAMRSLIAHPYLGGQGAKEAIYPMAAMDAKGKPLSGKNNYVMKFDQEPPVGAFWSVTVYDAKTKMLVENPINRYSINNSMPLKRGDDGSFEIHLSNQALSDNQNWLPIPEGEFYLLTRLYVPSQEVLRMEWTVPGLEKIQ
ncbi:DUF1254 domain-containing protein [Vibrio maritimus]|uniref:DUF1254 domain-containing protein n=1 Tax=Vibrio maritimus TaxID=990268 RepID=UPI004067E9EF